MSSPFFSLVLASSCSYSWETPKTSSVSPQCLLPSLPSLILSLRAFVFVSLPVEGGVWVLINFTCPAPSQNGAVVVKRVTGQPVPHYLKQENGHPELELHVLVNLEAETGSKLRTFIKLLLFGGWFAPFPIRCILGVPGCGRPLSASVCSLRVSVGLGLQDGRNSAVIWATHPRTQR